MLSFKLVPPDLTTRSITIQSEPTPWGSVKAWFWVCREHSELMTVEEFKSYCPEPLFEAFHDGKDGHWWERHEYYFSQRSVNWTTVDKEWVDWMEAVLKRITVVGQKKTKQATLEGF